MIKKFFSYLWGVIIHPRATFDELAMLTSIRPAIFLVLIAQSLLWVNYLLYTFFGFDWLGTRRELASPTYVGFFGHLAIGIEDYLPVFFLVIGPILALMGLVIMPGIVQVLSKIWGGKGSFEQMINVMGFSMVPSLLIQSFFNDMFISGVPANLIAGHPYAFTAAMNGEFGMVWSIIFWIYMIGVYILGTSAWVIVLGAIAIHRIQRIPARAATIIMLFAFMLWFFGVNGSVVR